MTSKKRRSTDYDFTPQMKRLSFDDAEEYKRSIYDKTIKMLYNGAKSSVASASIVKPSASDHCLPSSDRKQFKQVLLDHNGKLDSKRTVISTSKEYYPPFSEKCSFCERLNCFTPLHKCDECNDYFCGNCSLSKYAENEEVLFCLSCFK